jgi:hypothetical protein
MPYKLKKFGSGYKVCKKYGKQKCFSKKPLPKEKAKAQMRAIIANESLSFEDYFILSEALEFKNGEFSIKADDGKDITLAQIFKDIKDNRKEILNRIKKGIRSYHFSPLIIAASMLLAGINTQKFIDQNPEVLEYGIDQKIVNKAADFLDKNPKILKLFQ